MPVQRTTHRAAWVRRGLMFVLLGMCIWDGSHPANAGEPQIKSSSAVKTPEPVEVRFTDNSSLKLTLREETLEVITRYGRLTIPVADVRRIEFATRVPDDICRLVEAAVRDLGDPQFRQREAACNELRNFRERAYPTLLQAAKSGNPEVVRRAEELLEWMHETVPPEQLEIRPYDIVHTEDMKITGRIVAGVFKAHTYQFGEQALKLADLRSLRALSVAEAEVETVPQNVLPDPGNLRNMPNQVGKTFHFRVTGVVNNQVWGTDVYTADSVLAAAAVHAGVLRPGQTGVVRVTVVPPPPGYTGSTRHGVTSAAYGNYPFAYQVGR